MVLLYKCIITGDEMFSDAYPFAYKYEGAMITVKSEIVVRKADKFDMGDCDDVEDQDSRVNNIVDTFRFNEAKIQKEDFLTYMKTYMKAVVTILDEKKIDSSNFKAQATAFVKFTLLNFAEYEFYFTESNGETIIPAFWENPSDKGPVFYFFKDAMRAEKY